MFALVDANNFYASCEQIFQPGLVGKPIAVLSNNDGCVIARSAECKALGIGMAEPYFACKARFAQYRVKAFSANFTLYGDISKRLMQLLSQVSGLPLEIYSIDEAFIDMHGLDAKQYPILAHRLHHTAGRWLSLPISIGMAPTKTLAKLANHMAKKHHRAIIIDTPAKHREALEQSKLADIWGIGRKNCFRLQRAGISTAAEFAAFDSHWVRKELGIHGERLQLELNGIPCASLAVHTPRKHVLVSRSFGQKVASKQDLYEAITHFCVRAAEKLRSQGSLATWLDTSLYLSSEKRGRRISQHSGMRGLPCPSNDPRLLATHAWRSIDEMFTRHARYAKAGILAGGLIEENTRYQTDMFNPPDRRSHALWQAIDKINRRYGRDTLYLAVQRGGTGADGKMRGKRRRWHMRQQYQSPRYTTRWEDVLNVNV